MILFDEFRHGVARGEIALKSEDFMTEFGRRVFGVLCQLENSPEGYSKALLGQYFNLEEIGRLEKLEVERMQLSRNDREVFDSLIASLKAEKNTGGDMSGQDLLAKLRQSRADKTNK